MITNSDIRWGWRALTHTEKEECRPDGGLLFSGQQQRWPHTQSTFLGRGFRQRQIVAHLNVNSMEALLQCFLKMRRGSRGGRLELSS